MGSDPGHGAHHPAGSSQLFAWLQAQRKGGDNWRQGAQVGSSAFGVTPDPVWPLNLITEDLGEGDAPNPREVQYSHIQFLTG